MSPSPGSWGRRGTFSTKLPVRPPPGLPLGSRARRAGFFLSVCSGMGERLLQLQGGPADLCVRALLAPGGAWSQPREKTSASVFPMGALRPLPSR